MTHICVCKLSTIGSNNGLSLGRRQAVIWNNAAILLIRPLGTNFSEILIGIQTFSFKKIHLKMSSAKWRPFCLCLNVFMTVRYLWFHAITSLTPPPTLYICTAFYIAAAVWFVCWPMNRGFKTSHHLPIRSLMAWWIKACGLFYYGR